MLAVIIEQVKREGVFSVDDPDLAAAMIKALLQDWYVKRWKYAQRRVKVDDYAKAVAAMALAFWRPAVPRSARTKKNERH